MRIQEMTDRQGGLWGLCIRKNRLEPVLRKEYVTRALYILEPVQAGLDVFLPISSPEGMT